MHFDKNGARCTSLPLLAELLIFFSGLLHFLPTLFPPPPKKKKSYYPSETAAAQSCNWKKASNLLLSIQDDNNHPDSSQREKIKRECCGRKCTYSVTAKQNLSVPVPSLRLFYFYFLQKKLWRTSREHHGEFHTQQSHHKDQQGLSHRIHHMTSCSWMQRTFSVLHLNHTLSGELTIYKVVSGYNVRWNQKYTFYYHLCKLLRQRGNVLYVLHEPSLVTSSRDIFP